MGWERVKLSGWSKIFPWRMILVTLVLVLAYVGSYVFLSRRGIREAKEFGVEGFMYVACSKTGESEDLTRHFALVAFYAPLNWIDRELFGGEDPCECVASRLKG